MSRTDAGHKPTVGFNWMQHYSHPPTASVSVTLSSSISISSSITSADGHARVTTSKTEVSTNRVYQTGDLHRQPRHFDSYRVQRSSPPARSPCLFCNRTNHATKFCHFRKPCDHCGRDSHPSQACHSLRPPPPRVHNMSPTANPSAGSRSPISRPSPAKEKRLPVPVMDFSPAAVCTRAAEFALEGYLSVMSDYLEAGLTHGDWERGNDDAFERCLQMYVARATKRDVNAFQESLRLLQVCAMMWLSV